MIDQASSTAGPADAPAQTDQRRPLRVLAVLNPVAGQNRPDDPTALLTAAITARGGSLTIYETSGEDDIAAEIARERLTGLDLVVAVGGDGTVSEVAAALVGGEVPLGILAAGTANVLALDLGIPGDLAAATALLVGEHDVRTLDAMRVGDRHFVLQIGVGLDSLMIANTDRGSKRRWGRLAYLATLAGMMRDHRARRFTIAVDGRRRRRPRARQVLVANGGTLGAPPLRWDADIEPDDGELDLCIWQAHTVWHDVRQGWSVLRGRQRRGPSLVCTRVRHHVTISADEPLPVQADGEIIGQTPVRVTVVPGAVRVIVPRAAGLAATLADATRPAAQAVAEAAQATAANVAATAQEVAATAQATAAGVAATAQEVTATAQTAARQATVPVRAARRRTRVFLWVGVGALAAFAGLAMLIRGHHQNPIDLAITLAAQRRQRSTPWLAPIMRGVSAFGFNPWPWAIPVASAAALRWLGYRLEAGFMLGTGLANAVVAVLKLMLARPRPQHPEIEVASALRDHSFPSGHTIQYAAQFGYLGYLAYALLRPGWTRRGALALSGALVGLVGPSRIAMGQHWASDVLASYLLGTAFLIGHIGLYGRLKARQRPVAPGTSQTVPVAEAKPRATSDA